VVTLASEVTPLLSTVDMRGVGVVLDPWCGTQGIASALRAAGTSVSTNDINPKHPADAHMDALQPGFYTAMAAHGREYFSN
jgi:S-adenosylhomocysteine hydrolase